MAEEFDWILHEIFPDIDQVAPPVYSKPVPDIPVLDDESLTKSGHAADALIAEIDRIELIDLLAPAPDVSADVARFAIAPPAPAGFDAMLSKLVEEIMPSALGMAQLTPETTVAASKFLGTFTKRAAPSRRKRINDLLEKRGLYNHGIMDAWNRMLVAFDNPMDAALPEDALVRKATSFLADAA
jgi:hypothetical protein